VTPPFIERYLESGETIRYRGRPSKSAALMRPAILLVVFLILNSIDHSLHNSSTSATSQGAKTGSEIAVGLLLFLVLLFLVLNVIAAIAFLSSAQYAVTDRRVIAKYGLVKRTSVDLLLSKISGVKVNQGLSGRIFDFGTVVVQSSGSNRRLILVKSPKFFHSAILAQLEDSRLLKGTAAYQLDVKIAQPTAGERVNSPAKPSSAPPLPPGTPAQWREDPFGGKVMRYWDGDRWTDHTAPVP
jgi:uncharacterized membrane protein YdbT with pleckstrin-like domain